MHDIRIHVPWSCGEGPWERVCMRCARPCDSHTQEVKCIHKQKKTYTSAKYIVYTNPFGMDQYNGSRLERMNKICSRALLLKNSLLGEYLQS